MQGTVHEIRNQIYKFNAIAIKEESSDKKYIGVTQFRQMLGVLGKYTLSTRIFRAIDRKGNGKVFLEDYLIYNDIVSHGTQNEKNNFTFGTIDLAKRGRVNF